MMLKIAHITDLHLDEKFPFKNCTDARKRFDAILADIANEQIDTVICTGDIGENEGILYFFDQLKDKTLYLTLGNHDRFAEVSKYYNLGVNHDLAKIYWSTVVAAFKVIYLDSSAGIIDDEQLIWLERELVSSKSIIIFMHHPILGLTLKVDEIGKLKNRKEIASILTQVNNKVTIYCGHYHMEHSSVYQNITQYITPATAFQIKKHTDRIEIDTTISAYRIIQIENNKITSIIKRLNHAD